MNKGRRTNRDVQKDLSRMLRLLQVSKGQTLKELCTKLDINRRTMNLWFTKIEKAGQFKVDKSRGTPAIYKVVPQ